LTGDCTEQRWRVSHRADPVARKLADRTGVRAVCSSLAFAIQSLKLAPINVKVRAAWCVFWVSMGRFFGNRWWVVAASVCGLLVGSGSINTFAFGVFLKPVTEEFGIGRGVLGSALAGGFLLTTIGSAILGWPLDRWGTRRVMIPGLLCCAGTVALQATLTPNKLWIYFLLGLNGLAFCCQTPLPYGNVVAKWFDRERGLALGIALAGVGIGVAVVPQLATFLIAHFGWRGGYVGLAIAILIIAWLPVSIFLREPPGFVPKAKRERVAGTDPATSAIPGMLARESFKTLRFWSLVLSFFLAVIAINGTLTQVVALLTDRGMPVGLAVSAMSGAGIALIIGRIFSGWCLDRFWGPYVAVAFFLLPMVGIALLISGLGGTAPLVGAVLCGLGIGADFDLAAFFISRYFGLKEFAKLYGVTQAMFSLANGVGPASSGLSFDYFHGYTPIFIVYELLLAIACVQFLRLGPYPYPAHDKPKEGS
jgi:MFS family permease